MNKLKVIILILIILMGLLSKAQAETLLEPDDFVGFSFWFISMACLATTVFFFLERNSVAPTWNISITVAGLVTGVAFIHFMYIRNLWVITGDAPIIYKYIEWFITMPLLSIQFYLVLSTSRKISSIIFWKLLIAALVMVSGGYAGEAGYIVPFLGFIIWMVGWIFILYEIFAGDAGKFITRLSNTYLITAFETMRIIVTVGWTIYPLGYIFGYLTGGIDSNSLNVIYNFADLINKIAFGLVIWSAAVASTSGSRR